MNRNVIDVTDRLTPAARVLVRQRTDEMVRAGDMARVRYNDLSRFFADAGVGRLVTTPPPRRNFNDAWSGNPDTDKAWAHDILTGGH